MSNGRTPPIQSPTPGAAVYLRMILGFGVWFAIGLAPFLGRLKIKGFTAVIEMYPPPLQSWVIPMSGLLMGTIAVVVEYASERKRVSITTLNRWFVRTLAIFVAAFIALIVAFLFNIVRVEVTLPDGATSMAVVTGTLQVPAEKSPRCRCVTGDSAATCVEEIGLATSRIENCFGAARIARANVLLALLYFTLTGSFAASVGLLLLRRRKRR